MFEDSDLRISLNPDLDITIDNYNTLRHSCSQLDASIKGLILILSETCLTLQKNNFNFDTTPKLKEWWIKEKEKESKEKAFKAYLESLKDKPFKHLTTQEKIDLQNHGLY